MDQPMVGLQIRALNNLIRRYFDYSSHRREIESVTGNNGFIIRYLSRNEGRDIYQKDLERHFTITRSTASRVLKLMERKGLVERRPVEHDARLKKLTLTPRARRLADLMCKDGERMERQLVKGFSEQELRTLQDYLERMQRNISAGRPEAPQKPPEGEPLC